MDRLSPYEMYGLFKETLQECSSEVLDLTDDMFAYYVFEELPIGMVSFVHKNTLKVLLDEGLIDETVYKKSIELREYYLGAEQSFRLESVKEMPEFKHVMELSDEILSLLTY